MQYAIVKHMHSHIQLSRNDWEQIINNGIGRNSSMKQPQYLDGIMPFKWFSKKLADELEPLEKSNSDHRNGPTAVFLSSDPFSGIVRWVFLLTGLTAFVYCQGFFFRLIIDEQETLHNMWGK